MSHCSISFHSNNYIIIIICKALKDFKAKILFGDSFIMPGISTDCALITSPGLGLEL